MTRPVITALPPAPTRGEDAATFAAKANTFVAALPAYGTESNALGAYVENAADDANDSAIAAAASASAAAAFAGADEWVSGQAYAEGDAVYSPINSLSYRANTATSGTTDPSLSADWNPLFSFDISDAVGVLPVANGGTGISTLGTADQILAVNSGATALEYVDLPGLPIGALQYFAGATTSTYPGDEWLVCDGSVLTQTAYAELFSTIGLIPNYPWTWTIRATPAGHTSGAYRLAYGNDTYVYVGESSAATSTNAITWTSRSSELSGGAFGLAYGAGVFAAGTQNGDIRTTTDGITWTLRTSNTASAIRRMIYANNLFIYSTAGGGLGTSTNGVTWTARTSGTASDIWGLGYGNGLYLYGGTGGVLATSTDAITWTARTSGTTSLISAIAYFKGLYVYGGGGGVLSTSTNAITWTARTSGTNSQINDFAYDSNVILAVENVGKMRTSTDAITWTTRTSGTASSIYGALYNEGLFVAVTNASGDNIITSNIYSYNSATEFVVPNQSIIIDNATSPLYIKAE